MPELTIIEQDVIKAMQALGADKESGTRSVDDIARKANRPSGLVANTLSVPRGQEGRQEGRKGQGGQVLRSKVGVRLDEPDQYIDFMVKYKDWISISRQELDANTKPEEIAFLLNNIRMSVESKYYKFLGIDTAKLDSFAVEGDLWHEGPCGCEQGSGPDGKRGGEKGVGRSVP
jgi:hypothetical protein